MQIATLLDRLLFGVQVGAIFGGMMILGGILGALTRIAHALERLGKLDLGDVSHRSWDSYTARLLAIALRDNKTKHLRVPKDPSDG